MVQSIKNLIAAILIAISGFLVWTQILPAYELTSASKAVIEERHQFLIARQEIVSKIAKLNEEYNSRYAELQRMAFVIPESRELPEIITSLESMFSQTGNVLGEYVISDASLEGEGLKTIALTISSKGSYESFINLINSMEKNIRLLDIVYFSISEDLQDTSGNGLTAEIKANIYWFKQGEN